MSHTVQTTEIPLHWVKDDKRLDAGYYGQEGIEARVLIDQLRDLDIEVTDVDSFTSELFKCGRFKRNYTDEDEGDPYLTPTDMFMFPLKPRKWVSNYPDGLKAEPGWILITRSGTVGRTMIATEPISECVLTDDLVRAVPEGGIFGYLYAYLNTWIGKALLTKDQFGATVKHIDPHQIEEIPVPVLDGIKEEIDEKIKRSHQLKEKAYRLLEEAEEAIYERLNLLRVSESAVEYFGDDPGEAARAFTISSTNLEQRLDASYHIPWLHLALEEMDESAAEGLGELIELQDVAGAFVPPRFTRIYVEDPDVGTPMLQGSHVDMIEPQGLEYIWNGMDNLEKYIVEENWILVTCSGTIGNMGLVAETWDGWAATNHLIRITPDTEKVHPGYLLAFLQSTYGQVQFQRLTYGGVVDEIGESGELVDDMTIFKSSDDSVESEIGEKGTEAYRTRDQAIELEHEAIEMLETTLEETASV